MTHFFLGWLVCLTIVVACDRPRSPRTAPGAVQQWKPTTISTEDKLPVATLDERVEFLPSTRVSEIIEGKKNPKLDDILV